MKRNYLYLVAILFLSSMVLLFSRTHVFDERPAKAAFSEHRSERILPQTALLPQPLERLYHYIVDQLAP